VQRNRSRVNVYLTLAFMAVFFTFSLFPVTQGSLGDNPHVGMSKEEVTDWMDDSDGRGWSENQKAAWNEEKLWDGNDPNSGTVESTVVMVGIPADLGAVTEIRVDLTLVSLREDGGSTHFEVGFFDGTCSDLWSPDFSNAVAWYDGHEDQLLPGVERTISLTLQPGTYCLYFHFMQIAPEDNGYKSTIDIEMAMYWPRGIFLPISGLLAIIALPLWLSTQRIGKRFKEMKFPEGPEEKSSELQVLDAADAERVMDIDLTGAENIDAPDGVVDPYVQQFIDQGYSPQVAAEHAAMYRQRAGDQYTEPATETWVETPATDQPAAEPVAETAADSGGSGEWSDEQLLAAGWTQAQIDANRGQP